MPEGKNDEIERSHSKRWLNRQLLLGEPNIHSVKKVPGIDHSKSPLKEIVKKLFDAKLALLSSILKWRSSAICH